MLQWLLFNYIIGNSDAHAKNISFLVDAEAMRLAPLYDLACGSAYGYNDMAQSVDGETNFAMIGKTEWAQFAQDYGVAPVLLRRLVGLMVELLRVQFEVTHIACGERPINAKIKQRLNWDFLPLLSR